MRILHIARYASARVYKQVLCQQSAGWDVTLMAQATAHVDLHAMVESSLGWATASAMSGLEYDVVVLHTTISTANDAEQLTLPKCKVRVWDCHDYCGNEAQVRFDAVTCPSAGMAKHFEKGVVVYSKVPAALWPEWSEQCVDAVVFQGTMGNGKSWGDYAGLEQRLERPVFFYPSGDAVAGHEGCKLMKRLPYQQLLSAMSQYSAGYAGAANEGVRIDECVTNKFWEYIAAGLPVITYNSSEMEVLRNNYSSWDDGCKLDRPRKEQQNLYRMLGHHLTMESELDKLEAVYNG